MYSYIRIFSDMNIRLHHIRIIFLIQIYSDIHSYRNQYECHTLLQTVQNLRKNNVQHVLFLAKHICNFKVSRVHFYIAVISVQGPKERKTDVVVTS